MGRRKFITKEFLNTQFSTVDINSMLKSLGKSRSDYTNFGNLPQQKKKISRRISKNTQTDLCRLLNNTEKRDIQTKRY